MGKERHQPFSEFFDRADKRLSLSLHEMELLEKGENPDQQSSTTSNFYYDQERDNNNYPESSPDSFLSFASKRSVPTQSNNIRTDLSADYHLHDYPVFSNIHEALPQNDEPDYNDKERTVESASQKEFLYRSVEPKPDIERAESSLESKVAYRIAEDDAETDSKRVEISKKETTTTDIGETCSAQDDIKQNLDKKLEQIQKSTRTLFKIFNKPHNILRARSRPYYEWHLTPYFKQVHYATATATLLVVAILLSSTFNSSNIYATSDTKIWDSKADFESGSITNLDKDANPGHLTLPSTTSTYAEDFTTTDNYDAGLSSQVNWDTGTHKLTLAGGENGTTTDLSVKIRSVWGAKETIWSSAYDSSNHRIYYGGRYGSFGYYDGNNFTDLTSEIMSFWNGEQINSILFNPSNSLVYIVGSYGNFAKYNDSGTVGSKATNLLSEISSFWSTNEVFSIVLEANSGLVYLGGANGNFAKYDESGTPGSKATDIKASISGFWSTNTVYTMSIDTVNHLVYLGGGGGSTVRFAKYNGSTATDLTSNISSIFSTLYVKSSVYYPVDSSIYLASASSNKLLKWDGSSATDLSGHISFFSAGTNSIVYDSYNNILYLCGGNAGSLNRFASWDGAIMTDLSSVIDAIWDPAAVVGTYTMSFRPDDNSVYIGSSLGRMAKYNGSTITDISSSLVNILESYSIRSTAYGNNYLYLGGESGKLAKYNPNDGSIADLTSEISSFWSVDINSLEYVTSSSFLYIGGASGKFAKYDEEGTSGSKATNLTAEISGFWTSSYHIYGFAYNTNDNFLYLAGSGGRFAKYDEAGSAGSKASDIRSEISGFVGTNNLNSITYDSNNNLVYIGGQSSKFAKYNEAGGTGSKATDLTSEVSSAMGSTNINSVTYNSSNQLIYLGGGSGKFAKYNEAGSVGSKATDLTSEISGFWSTSINVIYFTGSTIYLGGGSYAKSGGSSGGPKFAKYNEAGSVGSKATDLTSALCSASKMQSIFGMAQVLNNTYLIGAFSYGTIAKYEIGYKTSGFAITDILDHADNNIKSATLTASENKPADTTIIYQLSSDLGVHWENVTLNTLYSFVNAGSKLMLKISFATNNNAITPEVTGLRYSRHIF